MGQFGQGQDTLIWYGDGDLMYRSSPVSGSPTGSGEPPPRTSFPGRDEACSSAVSTSSLTQSRWSSSRAQVSRDKPVEAKAMMESWIFGDWRSSAACLQSPPLSRPSVFPRTGPGCQMAAGRQARPLLVDPSRSFSRQMAAAAAWAIAGAPYLQCTQIKRACSCSPCF